MPELLCDPPARLRLKSGLEGRHTQGQRRPALSRVSQLVVALQIGAFGQHDVGVAGHIRRQRVDYDYQVKRLAGRLQLASRVGYREG